MDLTKSDNAVGDEVIGALKSLKSTAGNMAKGIRDRAKAREAQKISDAGNYFTMRAYLKTLIAIPDYVLNMVKDQGISEYAVIQLGAQGAGSSTSSIISKLKALTVAPIPSGVSAELAALRTSYIESLPVYSGSTDLGITVNKAPQQPEISQTAGEKVKAAAGNLQPYLPFIIGGLILALIAYFAFKK